MAGVKTSRGDYRTFSVNIGGKRHYIGAGHMNDRGTLRFGEKLDALVSAKKRATPDYPALEWASKLDASLYNRLAEIGLVETREPTERSTLGSFLDEMLRMARVKPSTRTRYQQCRDRLLACFGEDRLLDSITPRDADRWRAWLEAQTKVVGEGDGAIDHQRFAAATIAKDIGLARQFFTKARRWDLVSSNPFEGVKAGSQRNPDRLHYVSADDAQRLLDACPDTSWRCIIALCRWGGLRCPSEVLKLRWADIDWGDEDRAGRMLVRSPKTEHHEGKADRTVPLFDELRDVLLDAFELAEEGAERVVSRYPESTPNLRPAMLAIVRRTGLTLWPRLFQNLRASRVDDLRRQYPAKVCDAWVGNSEGVSRAHYESVREEDFQRAVGGEGARSPQRSPERSPTRTAGACLNPPSTMKKAAFCGSGRELAVAVGGNQWAQQDSNIT